MAKKNRSAGRQAVRRADERWLEGGGLDRPHTKIGVGTAKRLMPYHPELVKELKAYIKSAPDTMPASDYEAEHGPIKLKRSTQPTRPPVRYREISGGAPGLGKRR